MEHVDFDICYFVYVPACMGAWVSLGGMGDSHWPVKSENDENWHIFEQTERVFLSFDRYSGIRIILLKMHRNWITLIGELFSPNWRIVSYVCLTLSLRRVMLRSYSMMDYKKTIPVEELWLRTSATELELFLFYFTKYDAILICARYLRV